MKYGMGLRITTLPLLTAGGKRGLLVLLAPGQNFGRAAQIDIGGRQMWSR